ncbi:MAG: ribonuclease P protein component [Clostridia bacterium]
MKGINSINKNKDFSFIYRTGTSIVTPILVIYYRKNKLSANRVGITATKKIGNAVIRNRCRRIIRQAYLNLSPSIKKGYDFVFVARGKTAYKKSTNIEKEMLSAFKNKGIIKEDI